MLTVRQFREINEEQFEGSFDKMIHVVSVVGEIDPMDVQEWDGEKLINEYAKSVSKIHLSERNENQIEIHSTKLDLISFNLLLLGQFIDIEALVNDGWEKNIHKIASSIYLQCEGGEMFDRVPEKYGNINIDFRSELIDELPVNFVYGAVKKYLSFRQTFFDSYELFNDPYKDVNVEDLNEEELEIYNDDQKKRDKGSSDQWLTLLNVLSNNDITRFDSILGSNLFLTFNQVSWLKSNK